MMINMFCHFPNVKLLMDYNLIEMKAFKYKYFVVLALLFSAFGCERAIDAEYVQDSRIYFFERANDQVKSRIDSARYSFLKFPTTVIKDTVYIKVKTMGNVVSYDRITIGKTVAIGTTAQEGIDYNFIEGKIPSGSTEGLLPVVLYRTARLRNEPVFLNMTIGETKDFKPGVVEDLKFSLQWTDKISRPQNWPFYFGGYSDAKFRFVLETLGIDDFPSPACARCALEPGMYSFAALMDFRDQLNVALREYNTANPNKPIIDELTGQPITF